MFKQLPQVDFTFGIGDIVGSIALLVSVFTFYISHTQASQSEQIKASREIWSDIARKFDEVLEKIKHIKNQGEQNLEVQRIIGPVFNEIDYFAYLILKDEIKDKVVLDYYKEKLRRRIGWILSALSPRPRRVSSNSSDLATTLVILR